MAQQEDMLKEAQDYVNALASQRDFHQNECTKFMAAALKAKRENEEINAKLSNLRLKNEELEKKLANMEAVNEMPKAAFEISDVSKAA